MRAPSRLAAAWVRSSVPRVARWFAVGACVATIVTTVFVWRALGARENVLVVVVALALLILLTLGLLEMTRRREQKYRAAFERSLHPQTFLDAAGRIVEMNPAGRVYHGIGGHDPTGQLFVDLPAFRESPAMRLALTLACEHGMAGECTSLTVQASSDEIGSTTWDLSLTPMNVPHPTAVRLLVEVRDVTARRIAERAFIERGNLATMGRLTARVAHEINNPLAGIQNSFLLIRGAVTPEHPYFRFVGAIDREIARIASVTRQLYETYGHEPGSGSSASVQNVVSEAIASIELANPKSGVRVEVELSAATATVPFPDALLRRVVFNLVQNAVDVSPAGGTVFVTTNEEGGTFNFRVRDQRTGTSERVSEPKFDSPDAANGMETRPTGVALGLALIHGSVTAFGGSLSLHYSPEGGCMYEVSLPLSPTTVGVA